MVEFTLTLIALTLGAVLVGISLIAFWIILLTAACSAGVPRPDDDDLETGGTLSEAPLGESSHLIQAERPSFRKDPTVNLDESDHQPEEEYVYTAEQEEYVKNNTGRYLVRALHDFSPERSDQYQLTFVKGDLIWVVDSHPEEDWWIGEMAETGEKGYFPTNYVQVLKRTIRSSTKQSQKIAGLSNALTRS